jgi:hypothetical protein
VEKNIDGCDYTDKEVFKVIKSIFGWTFERAFAKVKNHPKGSKASCAFTQKLILL